VRERLALEAKILTRETVEKIKRIKASATSDLISTQNAR
jgi:hypothetical protein